MVVGLGSVSIPIQFYFSNLENFSRALEKLFILVWAFKPHLHFDTAKVQKIQI